MLALLKHVDDPGRPLSAQIERAARQLGALHTGGKLNSLPSDTRLVIAAVALFMSGAADRARDLEYLCSDSLPPPRSGRMEPIGAAIGRVVAQATAAYSRRVG